jgi:hypothetical protein
MVYNVYLSVFCAQCYPCPSFCLVPNVARFWAQDTERMTRVALGTGHIKIEMGNIGHKTQKDRTRIYLSVSCFQCYSCLSFCVLRPMLPVSIFLCLVPNVTDRKIDTGNIGNRTQKDRHGKHWAQNTER